MNVHARARAEGRGGGGGSRLATPCARACALPLIPSSSAVCRSVEKFRENPPPRHRAGVSARDPLWPRLPVVPSSSAGFAPWGQGNNACQTAGGAPRVRLRRDSASRKRRAVGSGETAQLRVCTPLRSEGRRARRIGAAGRPCLSARGLQPSTTASLICRGARRWAWSAGT